MTLQPVPRRVEFPACLDELFNVQVNKSRYRLDERLQDALISRLRKTVATIGKDFLKASASLSSRPPKERLSSAEERSVALRSKVKPRPKLAPKVQEEKTKAYEARKQAVIDEVHREADEANAAVQQKIDTAKAFGDDALATLLEESKEAIKAAGERRKKDVIHRFSVEAFGRKSIKPLRGGDLYHVEDYGERGYWVTINENSDFFAALYDRATQFAEQEALLDLLSSPSPTRRSPTNSPGQDFWRTPSETSRACRRCSSAWWITLTTTTLVRWTMPTRWNWRVGVSVTTASPWSRPDHL